MTPPSWLFCALLAVPETPTLRIDPLLLAQVAEVYALVARDDNPVWPGWNARTTPVLLYLPGVQDALVNHPRPPQGFVRVPCALLPEGWTLDLKDGPTLLALDGQNTSTTVNGVETLVVADPVSNLRPWLELLLADGRPASERARELTPERLGPDPYEQLGLIVHEAFHVHQSRAPDKAASEAWLLQYPWLAPENNAGFALEGRALERALTAADDEQVFEAALEWLAVRTERRRPLPAQAVQYEDGTEFNEGLAKYTEWRASFAFEGREPSPALRWARGFHGFAKLDGWRAKLLDALRGNCSGATLVNNDPYGSGALRFRLYYTGMAAGALLDRLGADDWRERIFEPGTTLTGLVREVLLASDEDLSQALARARAAGGWEKVLAEKRELERAGRAAAEAAAQAILAGQALFTLDYSRVETSVGFSFTPFGLTRVDPERTIYTLVPLRGELSDEASFQQAESTPTLHDARQKTVSFQLAAPVQPAAVAQALGLAALPKDPVANLVLELPGLRVQAKRARVSAKAGGLRLELVP